MSSEAIDYVLGSWCAYPDGTGVAMEYLSAVESVSVLPELMHASDARAKLAALCSRLDKTAAVSFESSLVAAIKKATGATSDSTARRAVGTVPGIQDVRCVWFDEIQLYNQGLSWEQQYLHEALKGLTSVEDESGLLIVLAMLARASRECAARKRATFSTIINRVTEKDDISSIHKSNIHPTLATASDTVKAAAERVHDICVSVIADTKDRAFDSTFLQPTLMYASMIGDESVLVDADVHGAPTYLALLEATTGIRTSRLVELDDDAKGILEFPVARAGRGLQALWAAENLGKSWRAIKECKTPAPMHGAIESNAFIFPNREVWSGFKSVRSMVDGALAATPENKPRREKYAKFIQQYCSYFQAEVLLPRLFTAVLNGTIEDAAGGCGSPDAFTALIEQVFTFLKDNDAAHPDMCLEEHGDGILSALPPAAIIPSTCDSVRYFVWNLECDPPCFNVDAARRVFAAVGVVKPHGWVPDRTPRKQAAIVSAAPSAHGKIIPKGSIRLTAAGDARGGGTGREVLTNLLNDGTEPWNKWLHPGYVARSWVQADFLDGKYIITGYGLCSANDCPHRDPTAWRLLGKSSPADAAWRVLHEFPQTIATPHTDGGIKTRLRGAPAISDSPSAPMGFLSRWHWLWFDVHDSEPLCAVKLEITSVRAPGDCLQLGHFHLRTV